MQTLRIVPYNPNWPLEYETIAAKLRDGLGPLALRVDHIGSTSVPGLPSKDIIDLQVTVREFSDALDRAFEALGYLLEPKNTSDHLPPGWEGPSSEWEKRYYSPPPGQRNTHTHVRIAGRANQRYPLLFRDYLRAHPAAAAGYGALKKILAQYHAEDRYAYTIIKDPVCDIIIAAAEDWARETGWSVKNEEEA